jgi:hypothetical protein
MILIGAVPTLEIPPLFLLTGNRAVKGWYSGTSMDSQETLAFDERGLLARESARGVRTHVERQGAIPCGDHNWKLNAPQSSLRHFVPTR